MPDREMVIKGLECCIGGFSGEENCKQCKYRPHRDGCKSGAIMDAIALLKAQEPRVLALDEIHGRMVVWLEYVDKPEVELAIGGSSACGEKCFITEYDMAIHPSDDAYNRRWRAWTAEPTEEQKEATPWEP